MERDGEPSRVVHSMCTGVQLSSLLDTHGSLRETRCSARLSRMHCCKVASHYAAAELPLRCLPEVLPGTCTNVPRRRAHASDTAKALSLTPLRLSSENRASEKKASGYSAQMNGE